jgi:hypothetical protein
MTTGTQTPLGVNALSSVLQNTGLSINQQIPQYVGTSHTLTTYTPGSIVGGTCLSNLTNAIQAAYVLGATMSDTTYNNLISIGASTIPALGNSLPPTYTYTGPTNTGDPTSSGAQTATWLPYSTSNKAITQWGFIRLLALQAWNEFNWNNAPTNSTVDYKEFTTSFSIAYSFMNYTNTAINSIAQSQTFLQGTYSNMDDLISADITGVSLATKVFGQDLIASGKVIDTSKLASFGLPSNLLSTLNKYNAITQSLSIALIAAGLTPTEVNQITAGQPATSIQEQKIYSAYLIIVGVDLADILTPLNCKTQGLNSLADLLNPLMLFPNSYQTLTVPLYNSTTGLPTNSKTYYPIYSGTSINSGITSPAVQAQIGTLTVPGVPQTNSNVSSNQVLPQGFGSYLVGILPVDVANGAGAFGYAMRQIKNVTNVPIEKLAQVVANMESTAGLNQVGGTNVPVNTTLASQGLSAIALGSGPNGSYTVSDFFGAMSCLPYPVANIYNGILQLQTSNLSTIYQNLYNAVTAVSYSDSAVQTYIDQANAEILAIQTRNPTAASSLNTSWNLVGTQLSIEQRARHTGIIAVQVTTPPTPLGSYPSSLIGFVDIIPSLTLETDPNMGNQTLEAIADTTTVGGQSIVAMGRQSRNEARLQQVGIATDTAIPPITPTQSASLLANGSGTVPAILVTTQANLATGITQPVSPIPAGFFDPTSNAYIVANMTATNNPTAPYAPSGPGQALDVGQANVPGSLAGSNYQNLIPPNLNTTYTSGVVSPSTYSVPEAINQVIHCNCDCWMS